MRDLIIIGGGAAGLSAAMCALSKQLDFLIIYDTFGKAGTPQRLVEEVDAEYLAGAEAVRLFERRIAMHVDRVIRDQVTEVTKGAGVFHITTRHHGIKESVAVIVATGARPITLNVPGARALLGRGLGYSITTHAPLLAGRDVAIIGTTVRALHGAAELARLATQVYLIAPAAPGLETPLARALQQRPNVTVFAGYEVTAITGTSNVEQVVITCEGRTRSLHVDAVFADLGLLSNSAIVRQLVRTDPDGFIWVDDRNATTCPGLFAAGDVTTAFSEQVLIAIGDGARAAISAYDYLLSLVPAYEMRPMI